MVSAGSYILSAAALGALVLSLGFSAVRVRRRLLPTWDGAPAHLVESILAVALLIWLSEILGSFNLLYASTLIPSALLLAAAIAFVGWGRGTGVARLGAASSFSHRPLGESDDAQGEKASPQPGHPRPPTVPSLIAIAVVALVFAHWGLTAKDALDRGIFNFDSLWYHMPFSVEMVQNHSVTVLHYTETVFTNWFYPQNSELLHAVGILVTHRDTLSLFMNFGWLAIAFLAAWCIGRPFGRGHLSIVAAAVVLESHTLVVREPGAAKNDLMAAALVLAAIAVLVNAWVAAQRDDRHRLAAGEGEAETPVAGRGKRALPVSWALAAAGLAVGLAAGTKSTTLAMAAALTLAVIVLAPAGRRSAAAAWWFLPALAGGGFWYVRNLVVAGNPLPQVAHLGPISLLHPERLQSGRPNFSIAHYATDTGVWRDYFEPGLHQAFGLLWPLVLAAAIAGGLLALLWGRERVLRWMGGVVLFGLVAYVFTPLSAAGAEGAPTGFALNIRYAIPALLAGLVLLPLSPSLRGRRREWGMFAAFLAILIVTDRADAVLRDPSRLFGLGLATLLILIPAAIAWADAVLSKRPPAGWPGLLLISMTALGLAVLAIGYPVERSYLRDRFGPGAGIPGMHLDSAYGWARGVRDARIGLAGTTAGFLEYGFYGTDLSNQVRYLGVNGPQGAFNAIPDCRQFRAAVNAAHLDYLVTAPLLNFVHPEDPIHSPEAGWLRGESAVTPIRRSGPVTVWRLRGKLDPSGCGPRNAPLRRVPQQPSS